MFASGVPGCIEKDIFSKLNIPLSAFNFDNEKSLEIQYLSSKGIRKEILLHVLPKYDIIELDSNKSFHVKMNFDLPKGSYATTVLREYIK